MTQPQAVAPDIAAFDVTGFDGATIERVLRPLARKANGLNGADIEELVKNARRKARREKRPVTYDDIESLLAGTKPPRSMRLLHRMAVHEAGHAVARLHFGFGPIIEITIDAPDGGYTLGELGQDEQTEELLTTILIENLSGRAAEEEILGSATQNSGGSERSDLALATRLALDMETILGFSPKWPLLYRKVENGTAILGTDLELAGSVNARLDAAYTAARGLVRLQRAAIEFLANTLLAEETLEGPELNTVLEQVRQKMVDPPQ
jgi:cell division protease FtsH